MAFPKEQDFRDHLVSSTTRPSYADDKPVTASDVEETLAEAVPESGYALFEDCRVWTFAERGLLTSDKGIVVRLATGEEFQITIVQSK